MGSKVFVTLLSTMTNAATRNPLPCMVLHVTLGHKILFDANAPLWYAPLSAFQREPDTPQVDLMILWQFSQTDSLL